MLTVKLSQAADEVCINPDDGIPHPLPNRVVLSCQFNIESCGVQGRDNGENPHIPFDDGGHPLCLGGSGGKPQPKTDD